MKTFVAFLLVSLLSLTASVEAASVTPSTPAASAKKPVETDPEKGHFQTVFEHAFSFQKIRTDLDLSDNWLFLTLYRDREAAHIDLTTGKQIGVDAHLRDPVFVAFDPKTRNLLVAQGNSRDYYVVPVGRSGPPLSVRTGLNPSWVGGDPSLGYYVLAGAVHLLYRLDKREGRPLDWTALGDRVRHVTLDTEKKRALFPLYRKERLMAVSLPSFHRQTDVDLGNCDHPRQALFGAGSPETEVLVLCRDGIYSGNPALEDFHRLSRFRKSSGMMVRIGKTSLLAISFPKSRMIRLWSEKTHHFIRTLHLDGRPVFLQGIPGTLDFLLVLDNPLDRESRVSRMRWVPDDNGDLLLPPSGAGELSAPSVKSFNPPGTSGTGNKGNTPLPANIRN
ncbi:hypothetical protein LptCag_1277 [Leptospirillum ferriphilum]|uniref:Uncharacterized protein n=2 Tax=Leptospirillum TaxID=179 RepID=A0A094W8R6_9BACT|nr:hypothetical protein [Leptospirillum ferriphilum]EDZ38672.1 MAG: Protein of unknown function [Leptospirillum sp. Group II '5-way CG']KGA92900.1 hypothetical protein LptCag_1277 [Leptospirillum ferriphilum]